MEAANASTPELMAEAKPQFASISVGLGNSFGLPRIETLERLANAGTLVTASISRSRHLLPRRTLVTPSVACLNNRYLGRFVVVRGRPPALCDYALRRLCISSRTRISIPPKPGNASWTNDAEVRSLSRPAESKNPFTTSASDPAPSQTLSLTSRWIRMRLRVGCRDCQLCHDISILGNRTGGLSGTSDFTPESAHNM